MTEVDQLTPNFHLNELRCPCCQDVNRQNAQRLALELQKARDILGQLHIVSGFRCPRWNEHVHGRQFSQHLVGLAADIDCQDDADRFRFVKTFIDVGFRRIGIARLFIHVDIGTITGPVIWVY